MRKEDVLIEHLETFLGRIESGWNKGRTMLGGSVAPTGLLGFGGCSRPTPHGVGYNMSSSTRTLDQGVGGS